MKQIITISKYTPAGEYEGVSKSARVAGIASTANKDRVGDTVQQNWNTAEFARNPVLYWNHDTNMVLGHVTKMEITPDGLIYEAELATTPLAMEVQTLIAEGHFTGIAGEAFSSVRFQSSPASIAETDTGYNFKDNKLMEISIVSMPANLDAMITSRSAEYPTLAKCMACAPLTMITPEAAKEIAATGIANCIVSPDKGVGIHQPDTTAPVEPSTVEAPADEPTASPVAASQDYHCLKALLELVQKYLKYRGGQH
jgi:HK97 family phage prohead protease